MAWLASLALALTGAYLLKIATPYGLGLVNDSAAYIGGAQAILDGRGFTRATAYGVDVPIVHFPPGFSLLLAATYAIGLEPLVGARLIVLGLFSVGILLFGWLSRLLTGSKVAGILGACLFAGWGTGLGLYSFALSEPLFLALLLGGFLALSRFLDSGKNRWLTLAAVAGGAASLTRYTGGVFLASSALAVILNGHRDGRRDGRWKRGLLFLLVGASPLAAWMVRNRLLSGSFTNRVVVWHPPSWMTIDEGIRPIATWLLPSDSSVTGAAAEIAGWLSWALVIGLFIWAARSLRGPSGARNGDLSARALGLFSAIYLAGLIVSISLFDASTPLDQRLLAPILMCLMALLVFGLHRLWTATDLVRRAAAAALAVVLVGLTVQGAVAAVDRLEVGGQGFAALSWQNSRAVEAIRSLPPERLIYTNRQSAVYLLTGKASFVAPSPIDPSTRRTRTEYPADLLQMRDRLLEGSATLALFHFTDLEDPVDVAWVQDLTEGIPILAEFNDATLYGRP